MSAKALNWAWNKVRGIKGSEKAVLARLADWANDEGYVWLGKEKIAADCCIGKRTVDDAIKELEKRGLVTVSERYTEKGRRTSNLYQLQLEHTGQEDLFRGADPAGVQISQGCKSRELGVQISQGEGADFAPEPPIEPSNEPKENSATRVAPQTKEGYRTKKGRVLSGKSLAQFEYFWTVFHEGWEKRGKAEAADEWYTLTRDIELPPRPWAQIIGAAKAEAAGRRRLIDRGQTPKMAQGWLAGRRFEDYELDEERKSTAEPRPWYLTSEGLQRKADRIGIAWRSIETFGEFMERLIGAMRERGDEVPAELLDYLDQVKEREAA